MKAKNNNNTPPPPPWGYRAWRYSCTHSPPPSSTLSYWKQAHTCTLSKQLYVYSGWNGKPMWAPALRNSTCIGSNGVEVGLTGILSIADYTLKSWLTISLYWPKHTYRESTLECIVGYTNFGRVHPKGQCKLVDLVCYIIIIVFSNSHNGIKLLLQCTLQRSLGGTQFHIIIIHSQWSYLLDLYSYSRAVTFAVSFTYTSG